MSSIIAEQLVGKIILPGEENYEGKRQVWNSVIDRKPTVIVVCENEQDVVAAVQYAKENSWTVSVRCGGHHVAGFAVAEDGLMIDVSHLKGIVVDPERQVVEVEAAVTSGELNAETQKYGLAVPLGTASGTGVAGVALTGGFGYLRGMYGLTCDNIIGANIVTAGATSV